MKVMNLLGRLRKWIGKLTDLLIKGREAGLWQEKEKVTKPVTKDRIR